MLLWLWYGTVVVSLTKLLLFFLYGLSCEEIVNCQFNIFLK